MRYLTPSSRPGGAALAALLFLVSLAGPSLADPLPDITLANVYLDQYCNIHVSAANIGQAGVPLGKYPMSENVRVAVYLDGQTGSNWCSTYLSTFDPNRSLSHPAGSVTGQMGRRLDPGQPHEVRVVFDPAASLDEVTKANNSITRTLTCQRPLPDLAVTSVTLTPPTAAGFCEIKVTVRNIGQGEIPPDEFSHGYLDFSAGGVRNGYSFPYIDKAGALRHPGGEIQVSPPGALGRVARNQAVTLTVDADSDGPGNHQSTIVESNEANNRVTRVLRCLPTFQTKPLPGPLAPKPRTIPRIPRSR
ncbi:hypothetical protein G3N55_07755 [Dissulfurirhabdus thermomarina]|uniref:CARDB domain-containing protein n=1 Tax=Dissulfurirhabdus thermomarina TaxID=1765737 RepID=A0A6N9TSL7_DISTH|nr:hypothetical protein [Dissulfurirhabdus thermomarina]NDY42734.1 hypothetical protein [Dissulfurirhabdus thermomarina]NMX22559.1 hypothetical protein [Dissulfurirhabdus thermomarina]